MRERIKESKQPEDFLIDRIASKVSRSKFMRGLFLGAILSTAALIVTACANKISPAAGEVPTVTVMPIETPLPVATLAPTVTKDPFEGLKECRTWREAVNCPITENDFRRISDYVKANFKFPPEALKVAQISLVPGYYSGNVYIDVSEEELKAKLGGEGYKLWRSSLSPIGKAFFFNLKGNPPVINVDILIAVFPVNNADGSLGTYTIIRPVPNISSPKSAAEKGTMEWVEKSMIQKFEKSAYCYPAFNFGKIPTSNYDTGRYGTLVIEIIRDTNDPKGKRKEMIDEWVKTAIIPKELEEMPMLPSV